MKIAIILAVFSLSAYSVDIKHSVAAKMRKEQSAYETAAGKSSELKEKMRTLTGHKKALDEELIRQNKTLEATFLQVQEIRSGQKKASSDEIRSLVERVSESKTTMAELQTQIAKLDEELTHLNVVTEQQATRSMMAEQDLMRRFGLDPAQQFTFMGTDLSKFPKGLEHLCSGDRLCYIGAPNHAMLVFGIRFFDPNLGIVRFPNIQNLAPCVTRYIQQVYILSGSVEIGARYLEQCGGELEVSVNQGLSSIDVDLGNGVCAALSCYVANWVQAHPEKVKGRLCSGDLCLKEFEVPKPDKTRAAIGAAWRSAVGYVDMMQEMLAMSAKAPNFSDKDVITLTTFK
jgi:arsenate reductase-like glutaredoxin family protein